MRTKTPCLNLGWRLLQVLLLLPFVSHSRKLERGKSGVELEEQQIHCWHPLLKKAVKFPGGIGSHGDSAPLQLVQLSD